jgi:hypothetical protein
MHYGCPDLLFYTKQNVTPPPSSRVLPCSDTLAPSAPSTVTATPGNGQATIKWNMNTEFDVAAYWVFKNSTNNPGTATLAGTTYQPDTSFVVSGLTYGTWYFWVQAVDNYCTPKVSPYSTVVSCNVVGIGAVSNNVPDKFYLSQNYPSPFNPTTTIKYGLKKSVFVELNVYDELGRLIRTLVKENQKAGVYEVNFDGRELSSGIYFYRITTKEFTDTKKMILIK